MRVFACWWRAQAIFAGIQPILSDQLLGVILPLYQSKQADICLIDFILFTCILTFGQVAYIRAGYNLNICKMDGPGFIPLFQQQLASHVDCVEAELRECQEELQELRNPPSQPPLASVRV